jgi:molybdopterin-guanine dinucleotide biosynthesis protein A
MSSEDFAAIVLAGGKSSRLGRDKASEPLLGVPLLQRVIDRLRGLVVQVVVVKARGQDLPGLEAPVEVTVVEDLYPESGPLGGLYTGLIASACARSLAVACDMPLLQPALVAELFRQAPAYDVVVPVAEDFAQPLCAVYSKACLGPIKRELDAGRFKLTGFYENVRVLEVPPEVWARFDASAASFLNLNRDEDLSRAEAILREEIADG